MGTETTPEKLMMEDYAQRLAEANHQVIKLTADNQVLALALEQERVKNAPVEGQVVND